MGLNNQKCNTLRLSGTLGIQGPTLVSVAGNTWKQGKENVFKKFLVQNL